MAQSRELAGIKEGAGKGKMDIKTILGEAHTDEIEKAILQAIGKEFIPKAKFDEANEAKKTAEAVIAERDKQIAELSKVDAADLQKKIAELTTANAEAIAKHEEQRKQDKYDAKLDVKLIKRGAVNLTAVKALLPLDKITLDGDDLKGFDEAADELAKNEPWTFNAKTTQAGTKEHGTPGATKDGVEEAFLKRNPEIKI